MGDTIFARLRVIGARRFRKEMHDSSEAVDDVGRSASGTRRPFADMQRGTVNVGRGLKALAIVCAVAAGAQGIGLLVQATGAGIVALGALGIAALGAGAVLAGFAMGATKRFEQMADVGGTAANDLKNRFGEFKTLLSDELGPAFDPVFQGLAKAMGPIGTLVREMAPAFKALGSTIGTAISDAAVALSGMGPEINGLLGAVADLVPALMPALLQLFRIFLLIATAAMPYLIDGLTWLATELEGVSASMIDGGIAWAFQTLADVFTIIGGVVRALAPVFAALMAGLDQIADGVLPGVTSGLQDLARGFEAIVESGALKTLATAIGDAFGFAAKVIGTVLTELQRVGLLKPVIVGLAAAFVAFKVVMLAVNLAMSLNPAVAIAAALVALAVGVVYAYRRFEGFRNAVNGAWSVLKSIGTWIASNWKMILGLLTGPVGLAVRLIVSNFGRIRSAATSIVGWVRDKFNGLVSFAKGLPGKLLTAGVSIGKAIVQGISDAFGALGGLGRTIANALIGLLNDAIPNKFGPFNLPDNPIPMLAAGGTVSGVGSSFVSGEAGPELNTVMPGGKVRVQPLTPGQQIPGTQNAPAVQGRQGRLSERISLSGQPINIKIGNRTLAEIIAEIQIDIDNGTLA